MNICERHENAIVVYDYPNRECPYCRDKEEKNDDLESDIRDLEWDKKGLEEQIDDLKIDLENKDDEIEKLEKEIEELKANAQEP